MTNMFLYPKPDMFFDFAVQNKNKTVNYFILT